MELNQIDEMYEEQSVSYKTKIKSLESREGFPKELFDGPQERARRWFDNLLKSKDDDSYEGDFYQFDREIIDASTYEGQLRLLLGDVQHCAQLKNEYVEYLFFSLCCYELSRLFYSNEERKKGYKCLFDANYYLGKFLGGLGFDEYVAHMHPSCAETASKGGKAKAEKVAPVKKEFIRLLKAKMPDGGWKNMTYARKTLLVDLELFIKKQKTSGLSWNGLPETLKRWSTGKKADLHIKAAFAEVLKKK